MTQFTYFLFLQLLTLESVPHSQTKPCRNKQSLGHIKFEINYSGSQRLYLKFQKSYPQFVTTVQIFTTGSSIYLYIILRKFPTYIINMFHIPLCKSVFIYQIYPTITPPLSFHHPLQILRHKHKLKIHQAYSTILQNILVLHTSRSVCTTITE